MKTGQWNLDNVDIPSIEIYQISIPEDEKDTSVRIDRLKLLILSHALAFHRTPAFFLEGVPKYTNYPVNGPIVIVFDLNQNFKQYPLPNWCKVHNWTWIAEQEFTQEMSDNFQRALTLNSYYELRDKKPQYFTAYLLFPHGDMFGKPFLFQRIPVLRKNSIYIRTFIQGSLQVILDQRIPESPGEYILYPPYEHPFSIIASTRKTMTALYVNKSIVTIRPAEKPFILLGAPNIAMSHYYNPEPPHYPTSTPILCDFPTREFHDFSQEDIDKFFVQQFGKKEEETEEKLISTFEFVEPTVYQLISELIPDKKTRKIIFESLGDDPTFPSSHCHLTLIIATFLSYFRFDFGFSSVNPPIDSTSLGVYSHCQYERLGIPQILVNCNGALTEVSAIQAIDDWVPRRFYPISGEKSGHFVVFSELGISPKAVISFFNQFCHIYKMLGFGTLSPFPRFDAFYYVPNDRLSDITENFFKNQSLSEFQEYPLLTFIVGNPIYDKNFLPHSILTYVRPWSVTSANEDQIATLAFVVYSRIRLFKPVPYGMIDISPSDTGTLFFGFRYQPPFLLRRNNQSLTIHIAFDPIKEITTYIDDIGSILHVLKQTPIDKIHKLIDDTIKLFEGIDIKLTLTIVGEGISISLYEQIQQEYGPFLNNILLFSAVPAPTVQMLFNEEFDDDAIIMSDPERLRDDNIFVVPEATCYVVSKTMPPYTISLYSKDAWKPPKTILTEFARNMSHLSWLSVKPGSKKRTISYPPHLAAMLRKCNADTLAVCRYEFLPSTEQI